MVVGCISTHLELLQLLSAIYSFQSMNLTLPLLNLFQLALYSSLYYCKWDCFLISVLDYALLEYNNVIDFCINLIAYNFLISLISYNYRFLGIFLCNIRSSANRNRFISSFSIQIHFISFPCFNALATAVIIRFNRSRESRHLCLVLDLQRRASSLS